MTRFGPPLNISCKLFTAALVAFGLAAQAMAQQSRVWTESGSRTHYSYNNEAGSCCAAPGHTSRTKLSP